MQNTIVMDIGSRLLRIGIASDTYPCIVLERQIHQSVINQVQRHVKLLVSTFNDARFTLLQVVSPLHQNYSLDDIEWRSVFPSCAGIIHLDVHVASCFVPVTIHRQVSISVHVGHSNASVMCLADMRPAMGSASFRCSPFGGRLVTAYLRHLMLPTLRTLDIYNIAEQWSESVWEEIKVSTGFSLPALVDEELVRKIADVTHWVGKQCIVIPGWIRYACMEMFWNGKYQKSNEDPEDEQVKLLFDCWEECDISTMIASLLNAASVDMRSELVSNILLSGGATQTIGFKSRLYNELCDKLSKTKLSGLVKHVNIVSAPTHSNVLKNSGTNIHSSCIPWVGASLAGSISVPERSCVMSGEKFGTVINQSFEKSDILSYLFENNTIENPQTFRKNGWILNADEAWVQR